MGLGNRKVVMVGVGAIGTNTAGLLAKAGVGSITIIDRDFVELKNLQRQKLFTKKDAGVPKAIAAKKKLGKINNKIKIKALVADLDYKNSDLLASDLVLDCTDNFETRFLINDYCRKHRIPWVYAAVIRNTGTVYNVMPVGACFMCIFDKHSSLETCDTAGVLNSVVAATASMQASEAIKILLNRNYEKDMVRIHANKSRLLKLKVKKNKSCSCCKGVYDYLSGRKGSKTVKLCGTDTYQIKGMPANLELLLKRIKKNNKKIAVRNFGYCVHFNNITLFGDGRAIVKAASQEKAKSVYHKLLG